MNRIVVVGAGYAGLTTAVGLAARTRQRGDVRVTLVNASSRFSERLRLHQVATGQHLADMEIPALLAGSGVAFENGWVSGIDARARRVRIDDDRVLSYDTLVYALGAVADSAAVPGADEHAHTLDTPESAARLAQRLASLRSGTVVVGGSGLTGVEAAAEIAECYPHLRVVLLGGAEPGSRMAPKAKRHLDTALERLGVEVRSGVEIVKVLAHSVALADGDDLAADAVLLTSGVRAAPLAAAAGLDVDDRGRIVTDAALRSISHPEVYAVGDAAAIRQRYGLLHGTCQSGMPTGVHAAVSIVRALRGKEPKPFRFGYLHIPVSLGRDDALVQFTHPDDTPTRFVLTGRTATWYKETVSRAPWPSFARMLALPAAGSFAWRRGGRYTR